VEAPIPLPLSRPHAVVFEHVAQRGARTDAKLGMVFAQVVGHRRHLRDADTVHHEPHRAASAGKLELGAAVEHPLTLLAPGVKR